MKEREEDQDRNYPLLRKKLVASLVEEGVLRTPRVVEAIGRVQRELFVPDELKAYAYHDSPLPTEKGQTISAPHGRTVRPGETWSP